VGIGVLGPLVVDDVAGLEPRDRAALAVLAVRRGQVVSPEQLADALWSDMPPRSWRKQVQILVGRLRRALGPAAIDTVGGGYRLTLAGDDLDAARFELLVERARGLAATGEPDRAVSAYNRALSLWRGAALPELDEWPPARTEVARLEELRRTAEENRLEARLAAGEHRDAAAEAEALVAQEPLRERRWAALALARYRCGRQADALEGLRIARRLLADQLGIEPSPELVALETAVLRQDPALSGPGPQPVASETCPYKGLEPYDAGDVDAFFGRDAEVAACLDRLAAAPLLVLAGASGSGKSSLLRAGLLPALRRRGSSVRLLTSGADLLSADLDSLSAGGVLAVDQFEELFTAGASTADVGAATARLAAVVEARSTVVVAVRSDHVAGLSVDVGLRRLAERGLHLVGPLAGDDLRAAVEQPARTAGLHLEEGLVDLLVGDTDGEPGGLPLLSHALVETWRRRDGSVLTVEGYRATGGIRGAVARTADRLHDSLHDRERTALRAVLLRLVTPLPDGEPVRCRVPRPALLRAPEHERVVQLLVAARLVTAEEGTFQLAHEALARAWPRLRSWIDDDAAGIRLQRHLGAAAEGWEALGRPDSELYRGARLDAAREWVADADPPLSDVERDFLAVSAERSASEARALEVRARRDAVRTRRLRAALSATVALLVVALIAGTVAVRSAGEARERRDDAAAAEAEAQLEALAGRSLALRSTARDVAALLAVEAYRRSPDARAWSALLAGFTAAPSFLGHVHLPVGSLAGAVVPGTSTAVVLLDGIDVGVLDAASGEVERRLPALSRKPDWRDRVRVSADGRVAAVLTAECADGCGSLRVLDLGTGRLLGGPFEVPVGDLALSADGALVVVSSRADGSVQVRRSADGSVVATMQGDGAPDTGSPFPTPSVAVAFDEHGTVHAFSAAGRLRSVDPARPDAVRTVQLRSLGAGQHLAPAGDLLVVGGPDGLAAVDRATGATSWAVDLREGLHPDPCPWLAVAPLPGRIYCGNHYGVIEERDLATGARTGVVLDPQLGSVGELAVTGDGWELTALGVESAVVSRWRLDGSGPVTRLVARGHVAAEGYDPTGRTMLVARREAGASGDDLRRFSVWDPEEDRALATLDQVAGVGWAGTSTLVGFDRVTETLRFWDDGARQRPGVEVPLDAFHLWTSAGGTRLYAGFEDGEIWTIDVATRTRIEPTLQVDGLPLSVSATADGTHVVVTAGRSDGPVTTVHDGRTGAVVAGPAPGPSLTSVSRDGQLAGASSGAVSRYDLDSLDPLASLPGARGEVNTLQWSDDGRVLLATSNDQTVSVYDAASGLRLGDPLPTASPLIYPGSLRPDGGAVAVTGRRGVYVWTLDPERLAAAACQQAGRNLTEVEWATHLAWAGERRATCPEHPL
jgi:DNA-binding SARP family transcriptional activator